ncbi:hypothetical protein ACFSM5_00200 [Lacibacterium aquatile]|uniref:Uncharacterized protein n=1 Tax=Lacibacterium aquatile TaxID=1168082 RepID=A0ABW5DKL3_9PROT
MWQGSMQRWLRNGALIPAAVMLSEPALSQVRQNDLTIQRLDCQRLSSHVPNDDVTYKPNADSGVAPADLPGSAGSQGVPVTADININARRYTTTVLPPGMSLDMSAGLITIDEQGKAYLNGRPLSESENQAVYVACRRVR